MAFLAIEERLRILESKNTELATSLRTVQAELDAHEAQVPVKALLDGTYRGPGPAVVYRFDTPGQIGPLEWDTPYVPNGSRVVTLRPVGSSWRIVGQDDMGQQVLPLTNGWGTYNDISVSWQWETARVTKLTSGIVVLSGMIQKKGSITNGELIGTLPVGMRPDYANIFGVNNSDNSKYVTIGSNGEIRAGEAMIAGGYISLDGIAFPAAGVANWTFVDPAGTAGSDHTFQNGWRDYLTGGGSYGRTRYWKDPYGFIWTAGMITGGTWTHNTQLFTWGALRSWKTHHIATSATAALGVIGVSKDDTGPRTRNGSVGSVWFSCSGPAFVTQEARNNNLWWDYPSKANGWVSFSYIDEYSNQFSECRRADGLTILYGMLASGTIGGGMGYTQAENVPRKAKLFHVVSADARGRLDIGGQYGDPKGPGLVTPQQGSNAWFAADSIKYVT
ncbi:MAG: hypothetical protein KF739_04680 [Cryobacterium sp.]|nr:hypothetical protein [Cryobacterium sp.]